MSRERELLERAYYVLGELSYAMLKDSGEYNLAGDIYEYLASEKQDQQTPMPCIYCDNGEGDCAFPYYGKAPHNADTHQILPECQWPDNFVSDPKNPECGEYTHCLFCMAPTKPDDVESLRGKLKEALRENFNRASWQCTEGGPWGDEGGSSYCKYRNKSEPKQDQPEPVAYWDTLNNILVPAVPLVSKRTCFKVEAVPLYIHHAPQRSIVPLSEKEMADYLESHPVENWFDFMLGMRLAERHHGIGGGDE